ncbi:Uncharacterised protein [Proteus mirabilis]|uniref:hypothetical protein n=1 Tax=Proteus mirabilis TaxID=584 RepID=UPI000E021EBD|nr:hypothetical protein [Proteus mirabilis]SUC08336.1 Uncharacterised protein [Proteus mirabilis]
MFDPFNDFEQVGYLRNYYGEKDPIIIRQLEHTMFRAGLDEALAYLVGKEILHYEDFWVFIGYYSKHSTHGQAKIVPLSRLIVRYLKLARCFAILIMLD